MKELLYNIENRHATWLELFFDLIFVVLIGRVTHLLAHVHNGHLAHENIIKFPLMFIPIWWLWVSHTLYSNAYDRDSKFDRFMTLIYMLLMVGMSVFIDISFEKEFVGFITLISAMRLLLGVQYLISKNRHPQFSTQAIVIGIIYIVTAIMIQISILFILPVSFFIIYFSIFVDVVLPILILKNVEILHVHKEHLVERIGLLTIILLGESVISIVNSIQGLQWDSMKILAMISGVLLIGSIWWILFDFYYLLEESDRLSKPYVIIIPSLFLHIGLSIIANVIRHAILNDIVLVEFKALTMIGILIFFLGKQIPYAYVAPKIRKNVIQNTLMVFVLIFLSLFLKQVELIISMVTLTVFIYIASTFRYMIHLEVASKHIERKNVDS